MFPCEHWEILKNNYFEEHFQTAVSAIPRFSYSLIPNKRRALNKRESWEDYMSVEMKKILGGLEVYQKILANLVS